MCWVSEIKSRAETQETGWCLQRPYWCILQDLGRKTQRIHLHFIINWMSHACISRASILSKYIKTSWYVSCRHQVVSIIYSKSDVLHHSAIIRLTGRGHHYDWLQRESGKTTCFAFEIQSHRRSKWILPTPVNRHVLIISSLVMYSR